MPTQNAQAMRCLMPATHQRGEPAAAQAMGSGSGQITRTLPQTLQRGPTPKSHASALSAAGIQRHLPAELQRNGGAQTQVPAQTQAQTQGFTRSLPAPLARSASIPQNDAPGSSPPPEPWPGSEPTPAPAAPRDRATPSAEALFPIIERVARGISGAAGYAYIGEDPDGAGLRYGLLGLRLDTGDMGNALRLAADRDQQAVDEALGQNAEAVLATTNAAEPTARLQPVAGAPLWEEPWKSRLSAAAGRGVFRAAQNEYAVEALLKPATALVLAQPTLASGTALAFALDLMAEIGRSAGLDVLSQVLDHGIDSITAFRDRLAAACPPCRLRLEALSRDPSLKEWRPSTAEVFRP